MNQAKICTNCGHKKSEHRQRYDSECCDHRYTLSAEEIWDNLTLEQRRNIVGQAMFFGGGGI